MGKRALTMTIFALVFGLGLAGAALAETVTVYRAQVEVKNGPGSYYNTVYTAMRGEALTVVSRQGGWLQVTTARGKGWVFQAALGDKKSGFSQTMTRFTGTRKASSVDATAGYKGFGRDTEAAYISRHGLSLALRQVDGLDAYRPNAGQVAGFISQGRLAR